MRVWNLGWDIHSNNGRNLGKKVIEIFVCGVFILRVFHLNAYKILVYKLVKFLFSFNLNKIKGETYFVIPNNKILSLAIYCNLKCLVIIRSLEAK